MTFKIITDDNGIGIKLGSYVVSYKLNGIRRVCFTFDKNKWSSMNNLNAAISEMAIKHFDDLQHGEFNLEPNLIKYRVECINKGIDKIGTTKDEIEANRADIEYFIIWGDMNPYDGKLLSKLSEYGVNDIFTNKYKLFSEAIRRLEDSRESRFYYTISGVLSEPTLEYYNNLVASINILESNPTNDRISVLPRDISISMNLDELISEKDRVLKFLEESSLRVEYCILKYWSLPKEKIYEKDSFGDYLVTPNSIYEEMSTYTNVSDLSDKVNTLRSELGFTSKYITDLQSLKLDLHKLSLDKQIDKVNEFYKKES